MKKETIICIVVVIGIVILNFLTQNYTKSCVRVLREGLSDIRQDIVEEKKIEFINEKVVRLEEDWKNRYKKLAYYIEHDELEKVHLYIVGLDTSVNAEEYSEALMELDKCSYILEHIEDKYSLNLKNIF